MEDLILELDVRFSVYSGLYGDVFLGSIIEKPIVPYLQLMLSGEYQPELGQLKLNKVGTSFKEAELLLELESYLNLNKVLTVVNSFEVTIQGFKLLVCRTSHLESNVDVYYLEGES